MRRTIFGFVVIVLFQAILLSGCTGDAAAGQPPVEEEDFMMGTVITQKVYGAGAADAVKEVSAKLKDIESRMTINQPGGEVNRLNAAAGKEAVVLSGETLGVLETAVRYSELSSGAFDVTIGPLVKAWGVFTDQPRVPEKGELERLMKLTDYRRLKIDRGHSSAQLEIEGQIADLGGIAKGHAGDEAIAIYRKHGVKSAYINLGGNVVVLGKKPDGTPWRIGIQNPRGPSQSYLGIVTVEDKAVVSSGDYERYFEKDGVRYHHILDPKTGYPASSGLIGTSIIADVSMDADALSTATFVLGLEKGMKLVNSLQGVEAIFVTEEKEIYVTEGLKGNFKFTDQSGEFRYVEKS